MCTDKKPSALNWINGRGKSVVAEVTLSDHTVVNTLKVRAREREREIDNIDLSTWKNEYMDGVVYVILKVK